MNRHPLALGIGLVLIGARIPGPLEADRWNLINRVNRADFACYYNEGLHPRA